MTKSNLSKGVASILIDYSAWTSIHGIPHIGRANAGWLRLVWTFITVVSFSIFIFQVMPIFTRYFSYPTNVGTQLEFGERVFPAITFCNLNPWDVAKAEVGPLKDLIRAYRDGTNAAYYGLDTTSYDKVKRAKKWQHFFHDAMVAADEAGLDASYDFEDLFISCTYNNLGCNSTDFTPFYDPYFGMCHIFNYDEKYTSSRAGPLYGLRVVLRTRQSENLPWIQSAGAVVYVHSSGETPFADSFGYYVPIGTSSSVGVQFVTREKMSAPYSACSDNGGSQPNYYMQEYEVESCIRSCLQDKIIAQCACYDPAFAVPKTGGPISCAQVLNANTKIDCIFNLTDTDGMTGFHMNSECSCPQNCLESYYKVTLSRARWPAAAYTPAECVSEINDYIYWTDRATCKAFYKQNTVLVELYYERMNYQVLEESAAYPLILMISDTGGQVGLWLGMSIISLIELMTLLLLLLCYFMARPTDAYHPKFDEAEKRRKDKELQDYLDSEGKIKKPTNLDADDLYKKENDLHLPPKVVSPR